MTEDILAARKLIDKIEIVGIRDLEEAEEMELRSSFKGKELFLLCLHLTRIDPLERDGWGFYFQQLTVNEFFKTVCFLEQVSEADEVSEELQISAGLTLVLLKNTAILPCAISNEMHEERLAFYDVVKKRLNFLLDRDDYEEAHDKAHEIMFKLETITDTSGWTMNMANHKN